MLEPHPPKLPDFVVRAAVKRLQANAWVIDRSVFAMTGGRDLLDFRLSRIKQPTLIVWGSEDVLIPLNVGESMHHLIPGSSMTVIDGCGHLAPGQCWHSALTTTVQFLKAEPAMKGVEHTLPGN
jgi:pimeloyl-ACP methyl ester carboxylesterase